MNTTTKNCPDCGFGNPAAARYCGGCGGEIAATVHCQRCGAEQPTTITFCTECGGNLHQQGVVVPEVAAEAPTKVDRCACGGLMKPKYKVGNGAISEVGGWLFGGEKRLHWVCQRCGQATLHEAEIEKEKAKEAAAAVSNVLGCMGLIVFVVIFFVFRACAAQLGIGG